MTFFFKRAAHEWIFTSNHPELLVEIGTGDFNPVEWFFFFFLKSMCGN